MMTHSGGQIPEAKIETLSLSRSWSESATAGWHNGGMGRASTFAHVEPGLKRVLAELRPLEPIFHTRAFGLTVPERERRVAPEYWEVGASGRRYSRDFILQMLEKHPPVDAQEAGWKTWDFGLSQLGPGTMYLLTYTLDQAGRITRRATVWHRTAEGWRILYHQGTLVTGEDPSDSPRSPARSGHLDTRPE